MLSVDGGGKSKSVERDLNAGKSNQPSIISFHFISNLISRLRSAPATLERDDGQAKEFLKAWGW